MRFKSIRHLKFIAPILLFFFLFSLPGFAQEKATSVTGIVRSEEGRALPGVSIIAKNHTTGFSAGAQSDSNGVFKFSRLPAGGRYSFAFTMIGFEPQTLSGYTLKENETTSIMVKLKSITKELDQVVVIGYGTQKKSEVTGSSSNIKGNTFADKPITSFDNALNGRAAGVNIISNQGVSNQAPVFRIRGTNSLSLSSYPLIVVDGVPTFTSENDSKIGYASTNPLSSINPADIESIDIAKDAASTSIYGSRAANGVVFITTKKGKLGAAKVDFQTWLGYSKANRLPKLLNAAEYIEIKNEGLKNDNTYDKDKNYYDYSKDAAGNLIDTRWYDYIYRTGISNNNNLSISGATQSTNYYGSVGYTKQDGIFQKNGFDRKSVLFNLDNKTTSWLNIGAKINYVNENNSSAMSTGAEGNTTASGAMARLPLISAPIAAPYNIDGSYNSTSSGFIGIQSNAGHLNQSRFGFYNPVISLNTNYSKAKINNIQSNAYIQIMPINGVSIRSVYGIDYRYTTYDTYQSPISGEAISTNGNAYNVNTNRERWVWTNTITFDKEVANHSFNLLLGEEEQKTTGSQFGIQKQGQTDPFYTNLQGGWQNVFDYNTGNQIYDNYLFSLFTRLQYNYSKKYYFTANLRQDEYSALGLNNKKGVFWGISAGWELMKENFWLNSGLNDIFTNFKVRASYGKVGNIEGLSDFGAINTYSASLYGGQSALNYSSTGNPDLQWETSKKTDFGLSFGMFNNKINIEIDYYKNNIDGLIFGVPLPPSVGVPNSTNNTILQNVGKMFNQGIEFSLSATPIRKEKFSWSSSFNLTTNQNKVTSLTDGVPSIIVGSTDTYSITLPGYSAGMIYAIRSGGIDPKTGRRIFLNKEGKKVYYQQVVLASSPAAYRWAYEDGTEAPAITPANDAVAVRNSAPKLYGGWNNSFNYGNFELNILFTYQAGGYMINGSQATMRDQRFWNNSIDVLKRWQKPGDITDIARIVNGDNVSSGNSMPLDVNISSSDYIRLKNAMVSYNFPKKMISKINFSNLKIYVSGQNLALLTKYTGMDPEVTSNGNNAIRQGIDKNQAPNARTITFGLNLSF
ncbi:MAG: SusC/RagA family TonB-linked outer membrane protein [Ginsengibacter sp.]